MKIKGGKHKSGVRKSKEAPLFHIFDTDNSPPGLENLSAEITVNGTTVSPIFRITGTPGKISVGNGGTADRWYPDARYPTSSIYFTNFNQGADITLADNPFPRTNKINSGCKFNLADAWQLSDLNLGNLGLDDMFFEEIGDFDGSSVGVNQQRLFDKFSAAGLSWHIRRGSTSRLGFAFRTAGGVTTTASPVDNAHLIQWQHYHLFGYVNRDESTNTYGVHYFFNTLDPGVFDNHLGTFSATSMDVAIAGTIGKASNGASNFSQNRVYLMALYRAPNIIQAGAAGLAEMQSIAQQRFYSLLSLKDKQSGAYPTTATRTSNAYLGKYNLDGTRKIYPVGKNWLRTVEIKQSTGELFRGYMPEPLETNQVGYSELFSSTGWNLTQVTVSPMAASAPDLTVNMSSLSETTAAGTHALGKNWILTPPANNLYMFSSYLMAGERNSITLVLSDTSGIGRSTGIHLDLLQGKVLGTYETAGVFTYIDGGIEDQGGGLYRGWLIGKDVSPTGFVNTFYGMSNVAVVTSSGDFNFTGDATAFTPGVYIFGAQLTDVTTASRRYPTSYISSSAGAAGSRSADILKYSVTNGNFSQGSGVITGEFWLPRMSNVTSSVLLSVDNASNNKKIEIGKSINGHLYTIIKDSDSSTNVTLSGSTSITDGVKHTFKLEYANNNTTQYIDGISQGSSTSLTIPTSLNTINIGNDYANTNQFGGAIKNIKFFKKPRDA